MLIHSFAFPIPLDCIVTAAKHKRRCTVHEPCPRHFAIRLSAPIAHNQTLNQPQQNITVFKTFIMNHQKSLIWPARISMLLEQFIEFDKSVRSVVHILSVKRSKNTQESG